MSMPGNPTPAGETSTSFEITLKFQNPNHKKQIILKYQNPIEKQFENCYLEIGNYLRFEY